MDNTETLLFTILTCILSVLILYIVTLPITSRIYDWYTMPKGDKIIYRMIKNMIESKEVCYHSESHVICSVRDGDIEIVINSSCKTISMGDKIHEYRSSLLLRKLAERICAKQYFIKKNKENLLSALQFDNSGLFYDKKLTIDWIEAEQNIPTVGGGGKEIKLSKEKDSDERWGSNF